MLYLMNNRNGREDEDALVAYRASSRRLRGRGRPNQGKRESDCGSGRKERGSENAFGG